MAEQANGARGRLFLLTFYKCGSQWLRDVLASPELLAHAGGLEAGPGGGDPYLRPLPELPEGTVCGPIYGLSPADWDELATPDDRAVVVLRDPRDIVCSLMFSALYSHRPTELLDHVRLTQLGLDPHRQLLFFVIFGALFCRFATAFRPWWRERSAGERTWVTTYETLVADERAEFGRIVEFLGWDVPPEILDQVVRRYSFETRSGRRPGEEDRHSHFRRGQPGDWRNHFDRRSGRYLEWSCPGLLAEMGYAADSNWFDELPEPELEPGPAGDAVAARSRHELEAEVVRLREDNLMLQHACDERLELIHRLTAAAQADGGE